jgi:hypothetical protein
MAQTVSTVRGSGSLGSGGGTATLFTQSGGSSTRVIFNQLAFYSQNSQYADNTSLNFNHVSSVGGSTLIGYYRNTGSACSGFQLFPNPNSTGPLDFAQVVLGNTYSYPYSRNGYISSGASNNQSYSGSHFNSSFTIGSNINGSFSGSYVPQNFWIGPGDSVSISLVWNYINAGFYPSANYIYHFTTITES